MQWRHHFMRQAGFPGFWRCTMIVGLTLLLSGCILWNAKEPAPRTGDLYKEDLAKFGVEATLDGLQKHNRQVNEQRSPKKAVAEISGATGSGTVQQYPLSSSGLAGSVGSGAATVAVDGAKQVERVEVSLDFSDTSLKELLQVLFEDYLKVPYTILESFEDKKVNFVYKAKASKQELLAVLGAFLEFQGVSMIYSNGVYALTTASKNPKGQPAELGVGSIGGAFRLRYLGAKDFLNVARQFLNQPANALELPSTNSIFVYAPSAQFKAVQILFERLDVPYFEGKYLIVYTPRYLGVGTLKTLIEHYHKMLGAPSKRGSKLFETEAVSDIGKLVIVAADRSARDMVIAFLHSVDNEEGNRRQIFQYVLTNQKANEVVGSVKNLVKSLWHEEKRADVVADKGSNSLFVASTAEDYTILVKLLERLDYRPPAVHIDVTLVEVVLTDSMKYGVEWYLFEDSGDYRGSANVDLTSNFTEGLVLDFVNLSNNKFITLEALAEVTTFRILANPQLIVKTGSTANLLVGQEIAIEKSTLETNTAGSSAKTEFERRDVAITLEVTPTIGANQQIQITLKLNDERDIGRDINNQPVFAKRSVKTDLVAYDGDTLFIGGIIRDRTLDLKKKIPLLGDLAYIGAAFFTGHESRIERTELLILVTPRLVIDDRGANMLTQAIIGASTTSREANLQSPLEKLLEQWKTSVEKGSESDLPQEAPAGKAGES